ncbi:MAG: protein phosphatase, partial [Silicimonas sp.]|nr:protein phosphatase [Silicimonas sp.]
RWGPDLVLTMTEREELLYAGAGTFAEDLEAAGVAWCHLPIPDRGAPPADVAALWPEVSTRAHDIFARGGRVFTHCYGGCGRAGMAALRLIVETGTPPAEALNRLRAVRPCAVETDAQRAWAAQG